MLSLINSCVISSPLVSWAQEGLTTIQPIPLVGCYVIVLFCVILTRLQGNNFMTVITSQSLMCLSVVTCMNSQFAWMHKHIQDNPDDWTHWQGPIGSSQQFAFAIAMVIRINSAGGRSHLCFQSTPARPCHESTVHQPAFLITLPLLVSSTLASLLTILLHEFTVHWSNSGHTLAMITELSVQACAWL